MPPESGTMPPPTESVPEPVVPPKRKRWQLPILVVVLILFGAVALERQPIQDWLRLRGYQPPTAIAELASQDTMTAYTKHLFYLNKPQLLSTVAAFRQSCPENKDTIVLGCYHSGQNGIFIYDVSDPTLAGVTQVTAAHEVLHAIYARLSNSARNQLNSQLESFYKNGLHDSRVQDEVKLYQQTEPNSVMDEMNSTFGTEVTNLPSSLENYYKQYFSNRLAIVTYEQQYENAFTTRQDTIKADDQQLATLKTQIDQQEATLSDELGQLNVKQAQMDNLKSSGQIDAYNAAVPGYNAAVRDYNSGIENLQNSITAYNQLVTTRNLVAADLTTLVKAFDTRLTTQSTR